MGVKFSFLLITIVLVSGNTATQAAFGFNNASSDRKSPGHEFFRNFIHWQAETISEVFLLESHQIMPIKTWSFS